MNENKNIFKDPNDMDNSLVKKNNISDSNEIEENLHEIQDNEELEDIGFYDNLFSQLIGDLNDNQKENNQEKNIEFDGNPNNIKNVLIENICDFEDEVDEVEKNINNTPQKEIYSKRKNETNNVFQNFPKNFGNSLNKNNKNNTSNNNKNERKFNIKILNDQIIEKFGKP